MAKLFNALPHIVWKTMSTLMARTCNKKKHFNSNNLFRDIYK